MSSPVALLLTTVGLTLGGTVTSGERIPSTAVTLVRVDDAHLVCHSMDPILDLDGHVLGDCRHFEIRRSRPKPG